MRKKEKVNETTIKVLNMRFTLEFLSSFKKKKLKAIVFEFPF